MIKASRETLGLIAAATAMTFALAYGIHTRPPAEAGVSAAPKQDWAGHLAELAPTPAIVPSEPLSSAALVVPKAQLALPVAKPASTSGSLAVSAPKAHACEDATCPVKASVPVPPPRRHVVADAQTPAAAMDAKAEAPAHGLLGTLNPLNHLPDVSLIGRPFAYAGDKVAGWIKRF